MDSALRLAGRAGEGGDVPVGAVVLGPGPDRTVLGEGFNRRQAAGDPLAHAEVEAIRQACLAGVGGRSSAGRGDLPTYRRSSGLRCPPPGRTPLQGRGWSLEDCTIVVTLEPCPMCAGAILSCHLGRVVFGAWDPKIGACGSVWDILRDPHVGPSPEVIGGVRQEECARVLRGFFQGRR